MKILVLGNGFDVDHSLPTSYKEFLCFCLYATEGRGALNEHYERLTPMQKRYAEKLDKNKKLKKKFFELLENNNLFRYFSVQLDRQGKNWIDLERELRSIVRDLRTIEDEYNASQLFTYEAKSNHKIYDLIENLGINTVDSGKIDEICLDSIHKALCDALDSFSKALELYIVNFIDTTTISGISPDVIEFDATNIITFNYSRTYERIYGGIHWKEVVDHIHGIAQDNEDPETNIVLGVTTSAEQQYKNRYVEFEKYFQRITKKTGSKYKEWLRSVPNGVHTVEIMFFGHSLDSSDSDIINDLIDNPNTRITICYHSVTAQKDIVANLTEIIGKQKLIEYVSGKSPKITFKKQRRHQHNNTAGAEIERDIRKLYKLYSLKSKEVRKLFEKIERKIDNNKLSYFFTQRKAIDLFEALRFVGENKYPKELFLDFCEKLNISLTPGGELEIFEYEEWCGETSWGDLIECSYETRGLIDLVNNSNRVRFQKYKEELPYAYIHKLQTIDEIKDALLKIFGEEISERYWSDLNNLMYTMVDNDVFYDAVKRLENGNYPIMIQAKIRHFAQSFYEIVYEKDIAEQERQEHEYV